MRLTPPLPSSVVPYAGTVTPQMAYLSKLDKSRYFQPNITKEL